MASTQHALERSLTALTLGVTRDLQRRAEDRKQLSLQEGFQQFQIPISGVAYQGVTWAKKDVEFDFIMFGSNIARDTPFDRPQFTYGVVIDPVDTHLPVAPVIVTAVCEYHVQDDYSTRKATIHVGIHSPTPEPVNFRGALHLTFQGWGAIDESAAWGGDVEPELYPT